MWYIILILAALLITGFARETLLRREKHLQSALAEEFLTTFIDWCNAQGRDHSRYNWLIHQSEVMQRMLGRAGLIDVRLPFEAGYHRNYPIILNEIPGLQRDISDPLFADQCRTRIQMVDTCLRRFIGSLDDQLRREKTRLYNPLALFCTGIASMMELPFYILSEAKIISATQRAIVVNGRVFALASGFVSLVTFASTVMAIVMGCDEFRDVICGWFGK